MTIKECLENILKAVFGKDVRQAIHDGIENMDNRVEEYTGKQDALDIKYDLLLDEMTKADPSGAEVVDARTNFEGETYSTLKGRLDSTDQSFTEAVENATRTAEDNASAINSIIDTQLNNKKVGTNFGDIMSISEDGVVEGGKYYDFHETSDEGKDFSSRLFSDSGYLYINTLGKIICSNQYDTDIKKLDTSINEKFEALRTQITATKNSLQTNLTATRNDLQAQINVTRNDLQAQINALKK